MNPDSNKFEPLVLDSLYGPSLLRPNGEPVPKHWSTFQEGERVVVKDYTFKVAYIGESCILLEPYGVAVIGVGGEP